MPLKKPRYHVLVELDDRGSTEFDVEILYGDQLRAELEGPRHGLSKIAEAPMHFTALWVWAALSRKGEPVGPFPEFKTRLLALEPVKEDELEEVDPTTGRTDSP